MKASKLTARGLAYVVRAVGRKIAKAHRAKQTPHGKQTVKKLMAHGTSTNSLELSGDTKLFDRVARKWNVDYAFYQTEPGKYLLFFKSGQADAMTACFSEYSRKVLEGQVPTALDPRTDEAGRTAACQGKAAQGAYQGGYAW